MKFLRRLIPYALVIFALVLVFPLFYGCSGGSQTSNRFHELLGLIPSDVDISSAPIFLNDYASFWEDNGISLVELDEQSITFQGLIDLILEKDNLFTRMSLVQGSDITGWGRYASQELIQDKYVGYSFASINAEIQAGTHPHEMVAAIGRFDPKATGDALNHQDEWPSWAIEAYDTEEYSGVTIHSWGDGLRMHIDPNRDPVGTPPHIDMLGRAMPLAVTSDYLFYTSSLDGIKSMIDSSRDDVESLADLPEYAGIVDHMYGFDVYSAIIGTESMANGDPEYQGTYQGPRLKKFVTFGSASGQDENGTYTALVLYHESPDDAESNISLLEQRIAGTDSMIYEIPWTELITDTDIYAEGNLLVAKLYTDRIGIWASLVYGRDILLLHEE